MVTKAPRAHSQTLEISKSQILAEWLLYVSVSIIIAGLFLPSIHKPGLLGGETYNVFQIVKALFSSGDWLLSGVVLIFSVIFPLAKNLIAAIILRFGASPRPRLLKFLHILGKWSMLDVFLAAFLVGFTQLAAFMSVEARIGLYVFGAGVLLNNLATMLLSSRLKPTKQSVT